MAPRHEEKLRRAKEIIQEEVEKAGCQVGRIVLFGSRARGDFSELSDWDFYVLIAPSVEARLRLSIADAICERLAEVRIYADVFVQSEETALRRAHDTGYLTYYALKEGIDL